MKDKILEKLLEIERRDQVTILYAAESGSRAWGFDSANSDYDCRFIFKRSLPEYIRVGNPRRDVIQLPIENGLDVNGWDVAKSLGLLAKSNPALMEWLFSPIVYLENGSHAGRMRKYISEHFSNRASSYHYLQMAKGNYSRYIKNQEQVLRKKYLYVLRPLLCLEWIKSKSTPPPVNLKECLDGLKITPEVFHASEKLLEEKFLGEELCIGRHDEILDSYINQALDNFDAWIMTSPVNKPDYKELDSILHEELGIMK